MHTILYFINVLQRDAENAILNTWKKNWSRNLLILQWTNKGELTVVALWQVHKVATVIWPLFECWIPRTKMNQLYPMYLRWKSMMRIIVKGLKLWLMTYECQVLLIKVHLPMNKSVRNLFIIYVRINILAKTSFKKWKRKKQINKFWLLHEILHLQIMNYILK